MGIVVHLTACGVLGEFIYQHPSLTNGAITVPLAAAGQPPTAVSVTRHWWLPPSCRRWGRRVVDQWEAAVIHLHCHLKRQGSDLRNSSFYIYDRQYIRNSKMYIYTRNIFPKYGRTLYSSFAEPKLFSFGSDSGSTFVHNFSSGSSSISCKIYWHLKR